MGHINPITEEICFPVAVERRDSWAPSLGAAWCLAGIRYYISVPVRARFKTMKVPIDVAIDRMDFRRTVTDHVSGTDVRETRGLNVVEIGKGPGSSPWWRLTPSSRRSPSPPGPTSRVPGG